MNKLDVGSLSLRILATFFEVGNSIDYVPVPSWSKVCEQLNFNREKIVFLLCFA